MTYDLLLGIVKFTNGADEIAYKMPHKIEQLDSLSDLEKEHTQSVYFRNEEDNRRGVGYVMNKGRQCSFAAGTSGIRANISGIGGNNLGQPRVVKCFNFQREGYMARQYPKPKRKRDATRFRDKVLLVEAQGSGKVLNEEELEFLADPAVAEENEITSDSNIIPYSQFLLETQNGAVQDTNSSTQQDAKILSVFKQLSSQVTNCNKVNKDNLMANESLSAELERYKEGFTDFEKEINYLKQTLSEQSKEKELLTKTFNVLKNESKEKEAKNIDTKIALEKKVKELDNIVCKIAQQIRPMVYDSNVIAKETNVISIAASEETLMLEEESRFKMLLKQSEQMVLKQKVNIKPINYDELNRLSEDFGKRFVPQQELSDEQALHPNTDQSASSPVKIKAPREFSKNGNRGLNTLKLFFKKKKNPFLKTLKDIFNVFDKDLLNEKKHFLIENDRLLNQIISQDIVNIVVNSSLDINTSVNVKSSVAMNDSVNYVVMCNKCLELEAELIKQYNMVEKDDYDKILKRFSELEQHCISLEIAMQLNREFFQKKNTSVNQTKPSFDQLFELNNLKAELQAKDTTIQKLKANIKRLNKTSTTNNVKKDIGEIETINIELEHSVTKLLAENEHLKQTYKQLYNSIKPLRVQAKEHAESLVSQLNQKSVEITAILSGAENRPPMLEKDMYDSWRSRMELYMLNRQHGRMILESVEHGPLLWPSVTEDGVTRLKKYSELSSAKATQADCDVKATNIILQALPPEIYALVSTHKVAKDLWERIQMLMQGTS
nr:retrovirus-related Pol polyprotein from transposon TNT 1-94 [Tanacetum cinerariifolium]